MSTDVLQLAVDEALGVKLIKLVPTMVQQLADELGISRAAIYAWRVIPTDWVLPVEEASGIPRELLRPDLFTVLAQRPKRTPLLRRTRVPAVMAGKKEKQPELFPAAPKTKPKAKPKAKPKRRAPAKKTAVESRDIREAA